MDPIARDDASESAQPDTQEHTMMYTVATILAVAGIVVGLGGLWWWATLGMTERTQIAIGVTAGVLFALGVFIGFSAVDADEKRERDGEWRSGA